MRLRPVLRRSIARIVAFGLLPASVAGLTTLAASGAAQAGNACQLNSSRGAIQHVIYIQFDNTHFTRDNPNVPSDLEQMPNLLNFIQGNGTLDTNHHTPLISHTANDILTSLTGVYPDRHGVPVANSFRYFNPNGTSNTGVSFAYWTDPIFDPSGAPTDTNFNMLSAQGTNAPAPWVPFTRAGCNVGAVATANTVLENIATDIPTVFGANSPQAAEVKSNPNQAFSDFVGIGVHCAQGNALCSAQNGGEADRLPDEPGGYSGYNGLFGQKYVAPQISPSGPLTDLNGNVIQSPAGNIGFPGFDGMPAAVSLSYVAAMQEHGIPVTYAYISDAHDNHIPSAAADTFFNQAYGPGEAGYVAALKAYDDAFGKFFQRLASDGINKSNTLFVFTADENDHFAGGVGTPAGCDGVNTPCVYSHTTCNATSPSSCPANNIGETNANLSGLLATQQGITTPFKVHSDSAPTVYVTGNPARDAATTRAFDQGAARLIGTDPQTGASEQVMQRMADSVEMKLLHMVTADPARTPTLTYFALPQYFLFAGAPNCASPCITQQSGFAWSHGDYQSEITNTWLGMVGPGVRNLGVTNGIWSDHTDIRPTILALVGLRDDYQHDGRVLTEALLPSAVEQSLIAHSETIRQLGQVYKQLNAAVGDFGQATLEASTRALASTSNGDATYANLENQLMALGAARDALAGNIKSALDAAAFDGQPINEQQAKSWIAQANSLIAQADALAAG